MLKPCLGTSLMPLLVIAVADLGFQLLILPKYHHKHTEDTQDPSHSVPNQQPQPQHPPAHCAFCPLNSSQTREQSGRATTTQLLEENQRKKHKETWIGKFLTGFKNTMYKRKKQPTGLYQTFALQKKPLKKLRNSSHRLGGRKDLKNIYLVNNLYLEYVLRKKTSELSIR